MLVGRNCYSVIKSMEKYVFYGIYVIAYVIYLFECVVNSTPPKAEVGGSNPLGSATTQATCGLGSGGSRVLKSLPVRKNSSVI